MRAKSFFQFLTEGYRHAESRTSEWFTGKFNDFEFEKEILDYVRAVEDAWIALMQQYWWNRESREFNRDHFALDVKLHVWPDPDEVSKALGREVDEDEVNHLWWRFIEDNREMWQEDLEQNEPWIDDTGFGGRSGGWLVVVPSSTLEHFEGNIEEYLQNYLEVKGEMDDEELAQAKEASNNPRLRRLIELGLSKEPAEVEALKEAADEILRLCEKELTEVGEMAEGLKRIEEQFEDFEKNAEKYFIESLQYN